MRSQSAVAFALFLLVSSTLFPSPSFAEGVSANEAMEATPKLIEACFAPSDLCKMEEDFDREWRDYSMLKTIDAQGYGSAAQVLNMWAIDLEVLMSDAIEFGQDHPWRSSTGSDVVEMSQWGAKVGELRMLMNGLNLRKVKLHLRGIQAYLNGFEMAQRDRDRIFATFSALCAMCHTTSDQGSDCFSLDVQLDAI